MSQIDKHEAKKIEHLMDKLLGAFPWLDTEQGGAYWGDVYNNLEQLLATYQPPPVVYFRSQIIPGNRGTVVYWAERGEKSWDVSFDDIPDDAEIKDAPNLTYENHD